MGDGPIRVFLVDDHEVVRRGVRELVSAEDDMTVVGEAGTVAEALARIPPTRPQVALIDVRLPDGSGVDVCRAVRTRHADVVCLMLTSFPDDDALGAALEAGARGFLLKQLRGTDIVDAVRRVARGDVVVDPAVARSRTAARDRSEDDERIARLTPQERRILVLVAQGLTNRQIAGEMHLAEKTVKNYVSNLLAKLGLERRTQAAVLATRLDLGPDR